MSNIDYAKIEENMWLEIFDEAQFILYKERNRNGIDILYGEEKEIFGGDDKMEIVHACFRLARIMCKVLKKQEEFQNALKNLTEHAKEVKE